MAAPTRPRRNFADAVRPAVAIIPGGQRRAGRRLLRRRLEALACDGRLRHDNVLSWTAAPRIETFRKEKGN